MKIRWRLLILLLVIALIPLILTTLYHQNSLNSLGLRLAEDTRKQLLQNADMTLAVLVDEFGQIFQRDKNLLLIALNLQAREIEHRLSADPPDNPVLYFVKDFDAADQPSSNLQLIMTGRYLSPDQMGYLRPVPISSQHQVFFLTGDISRTKVAADLARLSTMSAAYRRVHGFQPNLIHWQFTTLEDGIHTTYPGRGGYPPEYDPRSRDWYLAAQKNRAETIQYVTDPTTQDLMMVLSMPVYDRRGSFAGVTAISILYDRMFEDWKIPTEWSDVAETLIVSMQGDTTKGEKQLVTVLKNHAGKDSQDWKTPIEKEFLQLDDESEHQAVLKNMQSLQAGFSKVTYKGQDVLWAYGEHEPGEPFPLLITPYSRIVKGAQRAHAHALKQVVIGTKASAIIAVIMLVIVFVLAIWRSRKITLPIQQLATAGKQLAKGNFDAHAEIHTHDELEELGDVFNEMGPYLAERDAMIRSLGLAKEI